MKKTFHFVVALVIYSSGLVFSQDYQKIKSVLAYANGDTLIENLGVLSGAKVVKINGTEVKISSRYRNTVGNSNAASFIKNKLKNYRSLQVSEQPLPDSGKNIIAIQNGVENPQRKIIICAHFDTFLSAVNSPGADDNGTGTAAVLEAARVLSSYISSNTIVYAFFDREEEDLNGSEYFASLASKNKDSIVAVINLDMLGWDKNGYNDFEVVKKEVNKSSELASNVSTINSQCQIGANITVTTSQGKRDADNVSFWNYNFPAILIIELYGMENPFMHKTTDETKNINKNFFLNGAKLGIGMVARYTNLLPLDGATTVQDQIPVRNGLEQNYPNPFNPTTEIKYQIAAKQKRITGNSDYDNVSLIIYDLLGREVKTLVNEIQTSGSHSVSFDGSELASGTYFYKLKTNNFTQTKKMLLVK